MTKQKAKEWLIFIQAWVDGKVVQCLRPDSSSSWHDIDDINTNWFTDADAANNWQFRIKPTPQYRPWKPEEVPVGALLRFKNSTYPRYTLCGQYSTGEPTLSYPSIEHVPISFEQYLESWEYSLDHGKTWLTCGVSEG